MTTNFPVKLALASALVLAATCNSKDHLLHGPDGGGVGGAGGTSGGTGGDEHPGSGGAPPQNTGGDWGSIGGDHGSIGGDHGSIGGDHGSIGGDHGSIGGDHGSIGGASGSSSGGASGGGNCAAVNSLAECDALAGCHSVFFDPHTCGCASLGCCAHFALCADGDQARCSGQVSCAVATPYCEGPYIVSYSGSCFEGCVNRQDCAP